MSPKFFLKKHYCNNWSNRGKWTQTHDSETAGTKNSLYLKAKSRFGTGVISPEKANNFNGEKAKRLSQKDYQRSKTGMQMKRNAGMPDTRNKDKLAQRQRNKKYMMMRNR